MALLKVTGVIFIIFGIVFIWYKRKTTLTASTVGHLHRLIPSLKEKQPTLNSLLPILSEFVHPTKSKSTHPETDVDSPPSSIRDKPKMVLHRHTNPNKPKLVTPSAPSIETEPISLELFNRAVADLDTKGAIQLAKYKKFLSKKKKNGNS